MRLIFVVPLVLLSGCAIDDPCDSQTVFENGSCVAKPVDAAMPSATPDSGTPETAARVGAFGDRCKTNDDCAEPAPVCMGALGYCSAIDCNLNASLCPAGWTCFDGSKFQAGAPWACLKL